jgi:hypothetical protein
MISDVSAAIKQRLASSRPSDYTMHSLTPALYITFAIYAVAVAAPPPPPTVYVATSRYIPAAPDQVSHSLFSSMLLIH